MTTYKHQESFAREMADLWEAGAQASVRGTIRNLKNKAQSAYIAARVAFLLGEGENEETVVEFLDFIHPNNQ